MFSHPMTMIGFLVMAGGWALLLSGGAGANPYSDKFVNFHTLWIASGAVLTGGLLIVAGVVAEGASQIRQALFLHPQISAGEAASKEAAASRRQEAKDAYYRSKSEKAGGASSATDPEIALARELREKGLR